MDRRARPQRTTTGWVAIAQTADADVRATARHVDGLETVRSAADAEADQKSSFLGRVHPRRGKPGGRTAGFVRLGPPAKPHRNPSALGKPAPPCHRKLAKRRDATVAHPVPPMDFGDISVHTSKRFPRFHHRSVGHPDQFADSLGGNQRTPFAPVLHKGDRGLEYGSPRVGTASPRARAHRDGLSEDAQLRALTERPRTSSGAEEVSARSSSARSSSRDQTVIALSVPQPPRLDRASALALAVRGWHAVERGSLPGGPSGKSTGQCLDFGIFSDGLLVITVARRKFEHLPKWEQTKGAQFTREEALRMVEDGLAGRPSPLGLTSSARPSSTGGQERWKQLHHMGEVAPTELDRNMPSAVRRNVGERANQPSRIDTHILSLLAGNADTHIPHHRLNDKGTGLRSQHKIKRAINSSPWSLTMTQVASTHREWVTAANAIQERYRLRRMGRQRHRENDAATHIQKHMRGTLARLANISREKAALRIQTVERGRKARKLTAKERQAKRAARLAMARQAHIDSMLMTAGSVSKAKSKINARHNARQNEHDEKRRKARHADRLQRMSLDEALKQQQLELTAEQAEIEAWRRQKEMVCFGQNDPFSKDPNELTLFQKDVRTGKVIRCTDGVTRVVYTLEEARSVINHNFVASKKKTRMSGQRSPRLSPKALEGAY